MRQLTHAFLQAIIAASLVSFPLCAQSTRDSAGVRIVENIRPAWNDSERLTLSSKPRLAIGDNTDSANRFRQVRGVMLLPDGRIAVADGGSLQLRFFNKEGKFLSASAGRGSAPGQLQSMGFVRRLRGDTIAINSGISTLAFYTNSGQFVRTNALPSLPSPQGNKPTRPLILVAVLNNGLRIGAPLPSPSPRPTGTIWADSLALKLVAESNAIVREVGLFPHVELEQVNSGVTQRWLSAIGVFAGGDEQFYAGYGNHYAIHVYASDGKLRSIIRRAWTPTPITAADWEQWVVEWSKLWVKSTGAERERDIQKVREEPWAEELPAFPEFILDRTGRLWVREAHWQDAIAAGSLSDPPAVESKWSVFDVRGRWLGDVNMPANFQPYEIGTDYVTGKARQNGVSQVVIYSLSARRN